MDTIVKKLGLKEKMAYGCLDGNLSLRERS